MESPVNDYYFKCTDLSINISLSLKWALFGFYFFNSIKETINDPAYTENISFDEAINSNFVNDAGTNALFIDSVAINNVNEFVKEMENEYIKDYYNESSVVHFKLKLTPKDFIILQNLLFPKLITLDS